jgi:D-3-phosphoglycerate dehydrogenase
MNYPPDYFFWFIPWHTKRGQGGRAGMGKRFKILMYEPMHQVGTNILLEKCDLIYAENLSEDYLVEMCRDVDGIIIRANGKVTERIIESAENLKVIGRHGVGLEGIDLSAAARRNIPVVYTPGANAQSVAEHFVGLAIMLARKLRLADRALRTGNWNARYELIGTELAGKTLGILGFGNIGQATARICHKGLNMSILYYDVISYPEAETDLNARRVEFDEVFKEADLISINMPLLPSTRGVVDKRAINLMKPTAFIINMARGPIWNELELYRALKEKKIAGAGSDVYEIEPVPKNHPLFELDNFVGTPHMSAHTEEAMIRMSLVAKDVLRVLEGQTPENVVSVSSCQQQVQS